MNRHLTAALRSFGSVVPRSFGPLVLWSLGLSATASALAQSAVPNLMSYQSRVADAAGVPLGNTTPVNRIVHFRIYDSPNLSGAANRLFSEQQTVTIAAGEFSVLIGSGTPIAGESGNAFTTLSAAVFGGATRYLGVTIDDGDGNPLNDPEMSPRQQIIGTPFAFRAAVAESVAVGGVSSVSLANNAVTTTQLADAAVTPAKLADNAVDGSKVLDGSINLTDLSPSLQTIMPKPSTTYNQGLGAWNRTAAGNEFMVFPIDVSDLGVDGEVLVTYQGVRKDGGGAFSGRLRITTPNFGSAGLAAAATTGSNQNFNYAFNSALSTTGAATAAPTASIPFIAYHDAGSSRLNYSVTGNLAPANSSLATVTMLVGGERSDSFTLLSNSLANLTTYDRYLFPPAVTTVTVTIDLATGGQLNTVTSSPSSGIPLASYQNLTPRVSQAGFAGSSGTNYRWDCIPLIYIYTYYPGSLMAGVAAPFNADISNIPTGTNSAGAPQTHTISSIQAGTNKLTITVPNTHAMQIGDTVVLSGVTGTPAVNASYTIAAVPNSTSFEIAATGVVGPYTGGTVVHTLRFNKYRLWVAVHALASARVVVSDK